MSKTTGTASRRPAKHPGRRPPPQTVHNLLCLQSPVKWKIHPFALPPARGSLSRSSLAGRGTWKLVPSVALRGAPRVQPDLISTVALARCWSNVAGDRAVSTAFPAPQKTSASVSACKRFGISHPDLISTVALARWRSNVVRTEPFQRLFQHAPSRIPAPGVAPQPRRGRGGVPSVSSLPFPSRLRPFAPPASHNCPKFLNAKLHRCRQINELPAARSR